MAAHGNIGPVRGTLADLVVRLTQSRTSASRALAAVTFCSILAVAATAAGQSLASVQGFVSDETGAFLPGVTVELVDIELGLRVAFLAAFAPAGFTALHREHREVGG